MRMYLLGGIIVIVEILVFAACANREMRIVLTPCPNDDQKPARFHGQFVNRGQNKFGVNGTLVIDRNMGFDSTLEYGVDVSKCKVDMSHCEEQKSFPGADLCAVFSKSLSIYKTLITKSMPQLTCPMKAGSYDMAAGYVDTTFAYALGLTGYQWFVTYKAFEKKNGTTQMVFCQNAKLSMFTVKDRSSGHSNQRAGTSKN